MFLPFGLCRRQRHHSRRGHFLPLFHHFSTTVLPLFYNLSTICLPLFYHFSTTRLPLFYHVPTVFLPLSYRVPTTVLKLSYRFPTTFIPCSYHFPTTFLPFSYHLPTTILPFSYHFPAASPQGRVCRVLEIVSCVALLGSRPSHCGRAGCASRGGAPKTSIQNNLSARQNSRTFFEWALALLLHTG